MLVNMCRIDFAAEPVLSCVNMVFDYTLNFDCLGDFMLFSFTSFIYFTFNFLLLLITLNVNEFIVVFVQAELTIRVVTVIEVLIEKK